MTSQDNTYQDFRFALTADAQLSGTLGSNRKKEIRDSNTRTRRQINQVLGDDELAAGVIFNGDLTVSRDLESWQRFRKIWAKQPLGKSKPELYEGWGNHDSGKGWSLVRKKITKRNPDRTGIFACAPKNRGHYCWKWNGIYFVQLNLYCGNKKTKLRGPRKSIKFLKKVFHEVEDPNALFVICQHFGFRFDIKGNTVNKWWTGKERRKMFEVMQGRRIAAIFHGHVHSCYSEQRKKDENAEVFVDVLCSGNAGNRPKFFDVVVENDVMTARLFDAQEKIYTDVPSYGEVPGVTVAVNEEHNTENDIPEVRIDLNAVEPLH